MNTVLPGVLILILCLSCVPLARYMWREIGSVATLPGVIVIASFTVLGTVYIWAGLR